MRALVLLTVALFGAGAFARAPAERPLGRTATPDLSDPRRSSATSDKSAFSVCEEEESALPRAPAARPVLPCALADSGALDASCADATFYVVTPAGVLLCQIDVDLLVATGSTSIERAPPAVPGGGSPLSSSVFALASHGADVPLPIAILSSDVPHGTLLGPCDGHGRPPPLPS